MAQGRVVADHGVGAAEPLPNALVTTFTYHPLVGLQTSTDSMGLITTYEYDASGRLFRFKNHEGNVIEQYEYNYAQ